MYTLSWAFCAKSQVEGRPDDDKGFARILVCGKIGIRGDGWFAALGGRLRKRRSSSSLHRNGQN